MEDLTDYVVLKHEDLQQLPLPIKQHIAQAEVLIADQRQKDGKPAYPAYWVIPQNDAYDDELLRLLSQHRN